MLNCAKAGQTEKFIDATDLARTLGRPRFVPLRSGLGAGALALDVLDLRYGLSGSAPGGVSHVALPIGIS